VARSGIVTARSPGMFFLRSNMTYSWQAR
jgi:hypothetical protein